MGPSKTTRVPLLVGPSNSGKSTVVYPFDDLFTPRKVLHKPALGSSFALRNLEKKRFILWDDYRPVEYAHDKTIPVSLFLSLFIGQHTEIQVSQSFNDGNKDCRWKRGVVFTAKQHELWEPTRNVSQEDVEHMRNRCQEFVFTHKFQKAELKTVEPCAVHMARWIVAGAAAHDANTGLRPILPIAPSSAARSEQNPICGFNDLFKVVQVSADVQEHVLADLHDLGAVDVKELGLSDWERLESFSNLRPLQKRRLLSFLSLC